jgi:hypothetical protein
MSEDDREFVTQLRKQVIDGNLAAYRNMLASPSATITDPQWIQITKAFASMTDSQRDAVMTLVRKVIVDTTSNILGILDGSSLLRGFRESLVLEYGPDRERLNGDLQDILLEAEGQSESQ